MANTTISPNSGRLNLSLSAVALITAGALALVGAAPTVSVSSSSTNTTIAPTTGVLKVTTASGVTNSTIAPLTGTLTLVGSQPVQTLMVPFPLTGALALSGAAPTVSISGAVVNTTISPNPGKLLITTPGGGLVVPIVGGLAFVGQAPLVSQSNTATIVPGTGALGLTGYVSPQTLGLQPASAASLGFTGFAPIITQSGLALTITPNAGALGLAGHAPTLSFVGIINPLTVPLALSGHAPTVTVSAISTNTTITPAVGALAFAGGSPVFAANTAIAPNSGTLGLSGSAPTLIMPRVIAPLSGALGLSGNSPNLSSQGFVNPGAGALGLNGQAPTVGVGFAIRPNTGAMGLAGQPVSIANPGSPQSGSIFLIGFAPLVKVAVNPSTPNPVNVISRHYEQLYFRYFGAEPYGEFFVRVGDVTAFGIDWEGWLANYWQRGEPVTTANIVRPSSPDGYQFACIVPGQSGSIEPRWPAYVGATVQDGSAVWQCQALDTTSLLTTVQDVTWTMPTGVTLDGQALLNQLAVGVLDFSGAVMGKDYLVKSAALLANGQSKAGSMKFKVR